MQVKALAATLLREYDISLPHDVHGLEIFPAKDYTQLIVLPVHGSKLVLKRRQ